MVIKGFGNTETIVQQIGTIAWKVFDDNNIEQIIKVPNSFLIPESKVKLLSPQHWAQETRDIQPNSKGIWCTTTYKNITICWNDAMATKTIPIDRQQSNTVIMWRSPGIQKYKACLARLDDQTTKNVKYNSKIVESFVPDNTYDDDQYN